MNLNNNTIKTPDLSHIGSYEWEYVYNPAEDTFLLLDALENDLNYIYSRKPDTVLEIGSGSGIVITALSSVLKSSSFCLAIDINEHACKLTKSTSTYNLSSVNIIQGDLTSCFRQQAIDMLIFNPPYVVTPSIEVNSTDMLTRSWAGGVNGREVINKFLDTFSEIMSRNGFGYLVTLKENQPMEIIEKFLEKQFDCEVIAKRKVRNEELCVLKFIKKM